MSAIPPSHPPKTPHLPEQQTQQEKAATKKRVNEEIALAASSAFLYQVLKDSGRSGDTSSPDAKIKQIEQNLKDGTITLSQATEQISSLLKSTLQTTYGNIPDLGVTKALDPSSLSVDYIRFYQLFLDSSKQNGDKDEFLKKTDRLIEKVESGKETPQNAIAELNTMIQKTNETLSSKEQFPAINPSLFD